MSVRNCLCVVTAVCLAVLQAAIASADDFSSWVPLPVGNKAAAAAGAGVTLQSSPWTYLAAPDVADNFEIATELSIDSPATQFAFFGSSWSAWPDPAFGDQGFEAAVLLRADNEVTRGYRIQLSHKYQQVALVRFPDGGYVRSVPCLVNLNEPIQLRVQAAGSILRVFVNGKQLITFVDRLEPALRSGRTAIAASSAARVTFTSAAIRPLPPETSPAIQPHTLRLSARRWLGGRTWVFDGDEPILELHSTADPSCFAKLLPGYKPQLTFDSHWGLENQGAFAEATSKWTEPEVSGGGETLQARWSARHIKDRFTTRSVLTVGFDTARSTYCYDIDSELEVLPGEPFQFRYGFDFEHHTPLDPFRWEYLLIRNREGQLTYRPLSPFDPGPLDDIQTYHGLRVWHGRVGEEHRVSPAVEYEIQPNLIEVTDDQGRKSIRQLNTAVCAAFYDTGVSFSPVTARPGEKIRVNYRYTGYPAAETSELFKTAKVQDNPRIDPHHHFVFARDQWPVIRFSDALAMDQPWWGGRPFLTAHNARPTYDFVQQADSGMLRLGPVSYGVAAVGPERVASGRWQVTARVKSVNVHGPGGRIEVLLLKKPDLHGNGCIRMDAGNILAEQTRYLGTGSFDWKSVSFTVDVPAEATGLALGLGNAGTGEVFVSEVSFEPLGNRPAPAETLASRPATADSLPDAIWDLRMQEQQGLFVYNRGMSGYRVLELANIDWVSDAGRTAIRFAENPVGRADYPSLGILDQNLRHPAYRRNYEPVSHGAFAIGGHHGGGDVLPGLTLAAWIRPAAEMGRSHHQGKGDIVGYGARRFIMSLHGQTAPYALAARINVNDRIESKTALEADRWYHTAVTCQPSADQWLVRLYLDGQEVASGTTTSLPSSSSVPDSLILGAELFYLHDAWYRGLISDAAVLRRTLSVEEIRALMNRK